MNKLKFSKCPVCNNTYIDPNAIVCRYCGFPSINQCSSGECEHISEPDAYYCEICGSKTLLGKLEKN